MALKAKKLRLLITNALQQEVTAVTTKPKNFIGLLNGM